jgi:iron complex transport system substrate-binding protein
MAPRIVSLLPGATEIVCLLGLGDALVGVTHECDFPDDVKRLPSVVRSSFDLSGLSQPEIDARVRGAVETGEPLYTIDADLFVALRPELVLTQELCDVCAISSGAAQRAIAGVRPAPRVVSLHPHSLDEVIGDVERIGVAAGAGPRAARASARLRERLERVEQSVSGRPRRRAAILEWLDPLMASGHWVGDMLRCAGGEDVLGAEGGPSVRVAWEKIRDRDPEVLILAPCGFEVDRAIADSRALESLPGWKNLQAVRAREVHVMDGNAHTSRPGPRLVEGVEILAEILHPDVFPAREPSRARRIPVSG